MEAVPAFLAALTSHLAPGCDPDVVGAVFTRASAGYRRPRTDDGRRVSAITPSGVPFEASVTGARGRVDPAVRYVTETATAMPFFGPRLAAQREALADLAGFLPPAGREAAGELADLPATLFPDPAAVRARTRFALTVGVVHRAAVPGHLAGLKVYGNLEAGEGGLGRLARRWAAMAELASAVADLGFLVPRFATVEVDAGGRMAHKLYFRTARAGAAALAVAARRFGGDAFEVADVLHAAGVDLAAGRRSFYVCCAAPPGRDPEISFHLTAKALGLDPAAMAALARDLADRHHGATAAVDALAAAASAAGGGWCTTVIGVGLPPGGGVGKVNVYVAPGGGPVPAAGDPGRSVPPPAAGIAPGGAPGGAARRDPPRPR
ncbi:MAG TPA: hypothetical protein VFI47_16840 [Acidimicrobiales bacterium]|nr:hypothetical protein [Acidimicrobiales bacterium]